MINISVVIVTKNGEKTIKKALESVIDFKEVLVVIDSSSNDINNMREIISKYKNTIIFEKDFLNFSQIKNFWINKASCEYILVLDDDEFLSDSLQIYFKNTSLTKLWYNIFFHEYMWWQYNKYATWGSYHLRLVKKWINYTWDVHESFNINKEDIGKIPSKNYIFHYSHTTIEKTLNKFNYYTNMESTKYDNIFILYCLLIILPIYQFLLKYIIKMWFIEWWNWFISSIYRGIYEFIKYSKIIEKKNKKS